MLPHPPTLPTLHGPPGSPLRSAAIFMHDSLTSLAAQCYFLASPSKQNTITAHLLLLLSPPVTSLKP